MLIHPLFICISGPTSSGKSTVALGLKDFLENQQAKHGLENLEVNLLQQDDFWYRNSYQNLKYPILTTHNIYNREISNNIKNETIFEYLIKSQIENKEIFLPNYEDESPWDWTGFFRELSFLDGLQDTSKVTLPKNFINIVEGSIIYRKTKIFNYCDYVLNLEANQETLYSRRANRKYETTAEIAKIILSREYFDSVIWPEYLRYDEEIEQMVESGQFLGQGNFRKKSFYSRLPNYELSETIRFIVDLLVKNEEFY